MSDTPDHSQDRAAGDYRWFAYDPGSGWIDRYATQQAAIYRRCLDREGHSGACRFEDEPPPTPVEFHSFTMSQPTPELWVPPWERGDG